MSNLWWKSKRCGRCSQLVCPACVARPVVVSEQANFTGIKNVCKPCYAAHIGDAFSRDADVYEFAGAGDVPAAIRGTTVVLVHGATAGKESIRSVALARRWSRDPASVAANHPHRIFTHAIRWCCLL